MILSTMLRGAESMGFVVGALFFVRFWVRTRQNLFLFFAVGFLLEAMGRVALAVDGNPFEQRVIFYLPRLLAYLLIIAGIASKNLPSRPAR